MILRGYGSGVLCLFRPLGGLLLDALESALDIRMLLRCEWRWATLYCRSPLWDGGWEDGRAFGLVSDPSENISHMYTHKGAGEGPYAKEDGRWPENAVDGVYDGGVDRLCCPLNGIVRPQDTKARLDSAAWRTTVGRV